MGNDGAKRPSLLVPYILLAAGLVAIAGSALSWIYANDFLSRASIVDARVVDLAYARSDGTSAPIVNFATKDGTQKTFTSKVWSKPPAFGKGERIKVAYLPENPEKWLIVDFWSMHLATVILGFLGFVFSALGAVFLFFFWNRRHGKGGRIRKHGIRGKIKMQR